MEQIQKPGPLPKQKKLAKIKPFSVTCTQQLNVLRREALWLLE